MITYQVENFTDIYEELKKLAPLSNAEVGIECLGEVVIDKNLYESLEKNNAVLCVTCRDNMIFVGYAVYFVTKGILNGNILQAESNSFYLEKKHRKGFTGIHLLKYAESVLKDMGVKILFQNVSMKNDISKIFERMKYTHIEKKYAKEL